MSARAKKCLTKLILDVHPLFLGLQKVHVFGSFFWEWKAASFVEVPMGFQVAENWHRTIPAVS